MSDRLITDLPPFRLSFKEAAARFAARFPELAAEIEEIERLEAEYGSITAAAEAMGIPRSTLWHRLNRHTNTRERRQSYRWKVQEGHCVACWRKAEPGYVRCESCLDKQAERQAKYWDNLPQAKRVPMELRARHRKSLKRMAKRNAESESVDGEPLGTLIARIINEEVGA